MNNWHIDKKYFEESIQKGYFLLNTGLSNYSKKEIKKEIKVFKKYLQGNFDYYIGYNNNNIQLSDNNKNEALKKIKKQYQTLNNELFKYFNALYKENILTEKMGCNKTLLDMDIQKELLIKNYQTNSLSLLNLLKDNNDKHNILVEAVEDLEYSSYCYYSLINDAQLIIINPKENCYNFNHELEHALENIMDYNTGNYFQEVGAINFEMLFLDTLYDVNGYICDGDFEDRVFNMYWYLDEIIKYFNLIKELEKRNFNVSLGDYIKIVCDTMDILDDEVLDFTLSEVIGDGKDASMTYLFSYLQAIKIRKMHTLNKIDNFELIKSYLVTNQYNFSDLKDFKIYDDYINEMTKRIRCK